MSETIDADKIYKHWIDTSDRDYQFMSDLFNSKRFDWALFIGHIVIEKLLKAIYVKKNGKHAPYLHNLYRLAELSGLALSDEHIDWLITITSFNLNVRYDDYKQEFYRKCTPEFSAIWIERIKLIRAWLKKML